MIEKRIFLSLGQHLLAAHSRKSFYCNIFRAQHSREKKQFAISMLQKYKHWKEITSSTHLDPAVSCVNDRPRGGTSSNWDAQLRPGARLVHAQWPTPLRLWKTISGSQNKVSFEEHIDPAEISRRSQDTQQVQEHPCSQWLAATTRPAWTLDDYEIIACTGLGYLFKHCTYKDCFFVLNPRFGKGWF